jgi:excinuclease ABC subunit C
VGIDDQSPLPSLPSGEPQDMSDRPSGQRPDASLPDATRRKRPDSPEEALVEAELQDSAFRKAARQARQLPTGPGVYLFKDAAGVVIYIGKAKNLRSRASSYFGSVAAEEARTAGWVHEIADVDHMVCDSEVDALLTENRLIKDIQPRHNRDLKDDKSYPYLMITTREEFPRVEVTRTPPSSGVKLYGPFTSAGQLRGAVQVLQRIFKFRTCTLDIESSDPRWRWFRPCLLAAIDQCTAPCNLRIDREQYRAGIRRLQLFLDGGKSRLLSQLREEMSAAAAELRYEEAGRLRDEIRMLENLDLRGKLDVHVQPEVFQIDPKKGLEGLRKVLKLDKLPRVIEGVDIAHLSGQQTVASLVQFLDGLPFKPGYRRYKIQTVSGIDDFRSMYEVVSRRFRNPDDERHPWPDLLLIDGGKGQLSAVVAAFKDRNLNPPTLIALAKQNEEIYTVGQAEPLRLSRSAFSLRLLQYVRDEAHRFAQHYHHMLRGKATFDD